MLNFFIKKKKVLFYRDYLQFQGGHLKVWDYFNHINTVPNYKASIAFSLRSVMDISNPWYKNKQLALAWEPHKADILFLAGLDWDVLLASNKFKKKKCLIPVINLIQGLSHADANDHKYQFLNEPAVRICVSPEVKQALEDTGTVNGPIFTIPNGVDLQYLSTLADIVKSNEFLIVGIKNPKLGYLVKQALDKYSNSVVLIDQRVLRQDFIKLLAKTKIVICLPLAREGFYLPALEAMALGCLVVCPDCIGNRSFCKDHETCLVPEYTIEAIVQSAIELQLVAADFKQSLLKNAKLKVLEHDLMKEREQFINILKNIEETYPK